MENKINPKMARLLGWRIALEFSLPANEEILAEIKKRIVKIRKDIISGTKTEDEINVLLDDLERFAVMERNYESKVRMLKRNHDKNNELDEKANRVSTELDKLLNNNEEES